MRRNPIAQVHEEAKGAATRAAQTPAERAALGADGDSGVVAGTVTTAGEVAVYGLLGWTPLGDRAHSTANRFRVSTRRG